MVKVGTGVFSAESGNRERPILFSAPMVRALLDGRKTQTRRVITPNNIRLFMGDHVGMQRPSAELLEAAFEWAQDVRSIQGAHIWWAKALPHQAPAILTQWQAASTFGVPGDRLWVRESFTVVPATACRMSEGVQQTVNPTEPDMAAIYAAGWDRSIPKWKPSIHMPRWASRLTLQITDVRVERLQDISEADAIAEGLIWRPALDAWCATESPNWPCFSSPVRSYAGLWNHINGSGAWDRNPWIWAVSLEVVR
jgi:hypothetical protein